MENKKNVVVIGGGTGTFVMLSGLKQHPLKLSAIITMMDSGGSTGRLRDQYGVLPPGDVRQALVALSESDELWRQLFLYRFAGGDLEGHNFGNLFLTVLEKITGSFEKALEKAQEILQTQGAVIPITLKRTDIIARLENGDELTTEALIDKREQRSAITDLSLAEEVSVNPKALEALSGSDMIIVGPGDLYTSILPNFVFKDFVQSYQNSKAQKVLILNLMNKMGQTDEFKASDYLKIFEKYLGTHPFDVILINNHPISEEIKQRYESTGEYQITDDLTEKKDYTVYRDDFLSTDMIKKIEGDKVSRSLLRHDGVKIANYLLTHIK